MSFIHRKPLPTSIKTLGDLIQIKRYEKQLTLCQVAAQMGITLKAFQAWECDVDQPTGPQMEQLAKILDFKAGAEFAKPND